jgi:hypothetical protein
MENANTNLSRIGIGVGLQICNRPQCSIPDYSLFNANSFIDMTSLQV